MTNLELDDVELGLVRALVSSRLAGLDVEIAHTDTREFKEMLRGHRAALERVARKLEARGAEMTV